MIYAPVFSRFFTFFPAPGLFNERRLDMTTDAINDDHTMGMSADALREQLDASTRLIESQMVKLREFQAHVDKLLHVIHNMEMVLAESQHRVRELEVASGN